MMRVLFYQRITLVHRITCIVHAQVEFNRQARIRGRTSVLCPNYAVNPFTMIFVIRRIYAIRPQGIEDSRFIFAISIPHFIGYAPTLQVVISMVLESKFHTTFVHDTIECQLGIRQFEDFPTGTFAYFVEPVCVIYQLPSSTRNGPSAPVTFICSSPSP